MQTTELYLNDRIDIVALFNAYEQILISENPEDKAGFD